MRMPQLDGDSYFWMPTDPPYREKVEPSDRVRSIELDIAGVDSWVLSGSICSWGNPLIHHFTLAVLLHLPASIRMARLTNRERERHGNRIEPGGDMHTQHLEFMTWAKSYDSPTTTNRSLVVHERWLKGLSCPVIRLDSDRPVSALTQEVLAHANS